MLNVLQFNTQIITVIRFVFSRTVNKSIVHRLVIHCLNESKFTRPHCTVLV